MSAKTIAKLRLNAAKRQKGLCYWCTRPMANANRIAFDPMAVTADHLIPKCVGGPETRANIVAACRHCNMNREGYPDRKPRIRIPARTERY